MGEHRGQKGEDWQEPVSLRRREIPAYLVLCVCLDAVEPLTEKSRKGFLNVVPRKSCLEWKAFGVRALAAPLRVKVRGGCLPVSYSCPDLKGKIECTQSQHC